MYERLIIPGTHRLDGSYKSVGFIHWTPGRIILFRNASLPMQYLTVQSGHQGYKWNCYKLFTPRKL